MILPQPPAFAIILCAQAVSAAYMAAKGFPPVAAIQADHPILTHRLPHRYRRSGRHLGRIGPSNLSQRSVYRSDKIGKLAGPDSVVSKVTSNDFRSEMWIRALCIHGSPQMCCSGEYT
jgi:hypothetical protein